MERVKQSVGGEGLESTIKETLSRSFGMQESKANGVVAGRGAVPPERQPTPPNTPGSVLARSWSGHLRIMLLLVPGPTSHWDIKKLGKIL